MVWLPILCRGEIIYYNRQFQCMTTRGSILTVSMENMHWHTLKACLQLWYSTIR